MNKKILITSILLIILVLGLYFILTKETNSSNQVEDINFIEKKTEDLNPISKESAIKILQAEYGMNIANTEDDFKLEDKYYVVDVYIDLGNSEEHSHEYTQKKSHVMSLGTVKIDIYTGEIVEE